MHLSGKHDSFSLHPVLTRFVEAATPLPINDDLLRPSPLTAVAARAMFTIGQRIKRADQPGHQITLLFPLLPILWWPAADRPPTGLPLSLMSVTDDELEGLLCAELLRHAQLSPLGPVPEWVRQILNEVLTPAARQRLFDQSKKISQTQFGQWLGLSRGQLAHQSQRLAQADALLLDTSVAEPAFYQEWFNEQPDR